MFAITYMPKKIMVATIRLTVHSSIIFYFSWVTETDLRTTPSAITYLSHVESRTFQGNASVACYYEGDSCQRVGYQASQYMAALTKKACSTLCAVCGASCIIIRPDSNRCRKLVLKMWRFYSGFGSRGIWTVRRSSAKFLLIDSLRFCLSY